MPPKHIVATSVLVVHPDTDEILLIKSPKRGWEFPGGQVEEGEDLITATQRECEEETGVQITVGALVGVYTSVQKSIQMLGFLATYISGDLQTSPESEAVRWVARADALDMITAGYIHDRLRDMLTFDGRVTYRVYQARPYVILKETIIS
jgi:8-oxo-dGTP diphosphatase